LFPFSGVWLTQFRTSQMQAYFGSVAAVSPVRRVGQPADVAEAIAYLPT